MLYFSQTLDYYLPTTLIESVISFFFWENQKETNLKRLSQIYFFHPVHQRRFGNLRYHKVKVGLNKTHFILLLFSQNNSFK